MATLISMIADWRDFINESSLNAKYTDVKVVRELEMAYAIVVPEVFRAGQFAASLVTHEITVVADQAVYKAPPHIEQVLRLSKLDTNGRHIWEVTPRSIQNPRSYGVKLNLPNIVFDPVWRVGETLTLAYIPSGEIRLAEGLLTGASTTTSLVTGTPTKGTLSKKSNAYAGYNVTLTQADGDQETLYVSSSTRTAGVHTLTVTPAATLTVDATTTYDLTPVMGDVFMRAVTLQAAMLVAAREGRKERSAGLSLQYQTFIRQLRLNRGNIENIVGDHFVNDTFTNERLADGYDFGYDGMFL